jgi:hypothetical protein
MLVLRRSDEVRRINGRTAQSDDAAWSCPKHQHDDVGRDCADRTKHAMWRGSGAAVLWGKRGGCCCCIFWAPARGSCRGVAPMGAWLLELHRRHGSRELLLAGSKGTELGWKQPRRELAAEVEDVKLLSAGSRGRAVRPWREGAVLSNGGCGPLRWRETGAPWTPGRGAELGKPPPARGLQQWSARPWSSSKRGSLGSSMRALPAGFRGEQRTDHGEEGEEGMSTPMAGGERNGS